MTFCPNPLLRSDSYSALSHVCYKSTERKSGVESEFQGGPKPPSWQKLRFKSGDEVGGGGYEQ